MESIKELRGICQSSRLWADTWHGRYICRPISIHITRLVLFTPLSANHVTIVFFVTGVIASLFFISGSRGLDFVACLLLQLWYLLDHVDGEVARYRKTTSLAGIFMDEMVHYTVHPLIFLCIGVGQFFVYRDVTLILISIPAALSMIYIPLGQVVRETVFKKDGTERDHGAEAYVKRMPFHARLFSILHTSCTFPAVMNIITISSIASLFLSVDLMRFILWYYAIVGTAVWSTKVLVIIMMGNKR